MTSSRYNTTTGGNNDDDDHYCIRGSGSPTTASIVVAATAAVAQDSTLEYNGGASGVGGRYTHHESAVDNNDNDYSDKGSSTASSVKSAALSGTSQRSINKPTRAVAISLADSVDSAVLEDDDDQEVDNKVGTGTSCTLYKEDPLESNSVCSGSHISAINQIEGRNELVVSTKATGDTSSAFDSLCNPSTILQHTLSFWPSENNDNNKSSCKSPRSVVYPESKAQSETFSDSLCNWTESIATTYIGNEIFVCNDSSGIEKSSIDPSTRLDRTSAKDCYDCTAAKSSPLTLPLSTDLSHNVHDTNSNSTKTDTVEAHNPHIYQSHTYICNTSSNPSFSSVRRTYTDPGVLVEEYYENIRSMNALFKRLARRKARRKAQQKEAAEAQAAALQQEYDAVLCAKPETSPQKKSSHRRSGSSSGNTQMRYSNKSNSYSTPQKYGNGGSRPLHVYSGTPATAASSTPSPSVSTGKSSSSSKPLWKRVRKSVKWMQRSPSVGDWQASPLPSHVEDSNDNVDYYNEIARQASELDREGHEHFAQGHYDLAFDKYEAALKLKRQNLPVDYDERGNIASSGHGGSAYGISSQYNTPNSSPSRILFQRQSPKTYTIPNTSKYDSSGRPIAPDRPLLKQEQSVLASVATSINNMTYLKQRSGQASADETMAAYLKSLQMKRDILGPDHVSVGRTLNNIGSVFYIKNEYSHALKAYENALEIMQAQLGPGHMDVGTVISNIGDVYFAMGDLEAALAQYRQALSLRWGHLGPDDPKVIRLMEQIAALELGTQPQKTFDDLSDSENEEYTMEDQKRHIALKMDLKDLQDELAEDMKFFDLLERQMAIDMVKDKTRIFREMREIVASSTIDASDVVMGSVSESVTATYDADMSASADVEHLPQSLLVDTTNDMPLASVSGHSTPMSSAPSSIPHSPMRRKNGLSDNDRQNALLSVRERLAKLRAGRTTENGSTVVAATTTETTVESSMSTDIAATTTSETTNTPAIRQNEGGSQLRVTRGSYMGYLADEVQKKCPRRHSYAGYNQPRVVLDEPVIKKGLEDLRSLDMTTTTTTTTTKAM